jgi:preprotein translocase subunit SecG
VIVFLIVSVVLAIIVMMQEGKGDGLTSTLSGSTDTYWSKNKGKSKEAVLMKVTIVLGILYMALALVLASKWV